MKSFGWICLVMGGYLGVGGTSAFAEASPGRWNTQWDCTGHQTTASDLPPCAFYQEVDRYDQLPNVYVTPKAPGVFLPYYFDLAQNEINRDDPSQLLQKIFLTMNTGEGPVDILIKTESSPKTGRWGGVSGYRHASEDTLSLMSGTWEKVLDYWEAIRSNGASEAPAVLIVNEGLNPIEVVDALGKKTKILPEDSSYPLVLNNAQGKNQITVNGLKGSSDPHRRVSSSDQETEVEKKFQPPVSQP
jgi:hypothetical protein